MKNYNGTPETNAGGSFGILVKAEVIPEDTTVVPVDTTDVPVVEGVIILPGDFTPATTSDYSTTKEGVTVAVAASTVTAEQMRIFKGKTITISSAANITGIEFTCTANGTAQYGPGCFAAQDGYSYETDGKIGTWVGSAKSVTFTAETSQVRLTQIVVALDGDTTVVPVDTYTVAGAPDSIFGSYWDPTDTNNDMVLKDGLYTWEKTLYLSAGTQIEFKVVKNHSWDVASYPADNVIATVDEDGEYVFPIAFQPENQQVFAALHKVEPLADPTNCAEAAAAALSVSANNELYNNGATYTIEGYVTGIKTAYSEQYHNISFWMADTKDGGEVLQAYRAVCASETDAPAVGDKVAVTGQLTKYNTTPEFAAGCTYEITEHATVEPTAEYYLVGSFNGWAANEAYKFVANEAAEGEYMLTGVQLAARDSLKVIGVLDSTVTWYPEGENYVVANDGEYDIYFRPDGNGAADWYGGYFYVAEKAAPTVPTTCAEAREAILSLADNTFLLDSAEITLKGYVTEIVTAYSEQYANISFWMADAADGGQVVQAYRAKCTADSVPAVGDLVEVVGKMKKYVTKSGVVIPEFDANCIVSIIEKAVVEPTADYYLVGSFNGWAASERYQFKANESAEGEYMLTSVQLSARDSLKVIGVLDSTVTWYPGGENYVVAKDGEYDIYFRPDGNGAADWFGGYIYVAEIVPVTGPTTCAEAAEAALSVSEDNELYNGGATYTIEGYVTSIQTAYSSQYNNITFWMADTKDGGKVLEAYRAACASADDAPAVGDKVKVTGQLTKYNTTPEFAAGCTYVITEKTTVLPVNLGEKTIAEFLALKNDFDTCILTGVVDSIVNTTYGNLYISDATGQVYVYGVLTADGQSKKFAELGVEAGDILTIKAIYNEFNNTPQVKNAIFVSVTKTAAVMVHMSGEDVTYQDNVADEGWWQIVAQNDDYYITLSNSNTVNQAAGTYSAEDLLKEYSFLISGNDTTAIYFVAGSITLTEAADGSVTIAGQLKGDNNITYDILLVYDETTTGIDNNAVEVKAVKVIREGMLFIEKAGVKYNVIGQKIR